MRSRVDAIRAIRLNYRWRGVYVWLRGRQRRYGGRRGWRVVLAEPQRVAQDQHALADGAYI